MNSSEEDESKTQSSRICEGFSQEKNRSTDSQRMILSNNKEIGDLRQHINQAKVKEEVQYSLYKKLKFYSRKKKYKIKSQKND